MVNLSKGGNINLAKEAAGITVFRMGLAWDASQNGGAPFDLDAAAIPLKEDGKAPNGDAICFYHQLDWGNGAIKHSGDERTGAAAGDDETITIDTAKLPADIAKVVVLVNIHDAKARQQNFGMVKNSKVTLYKGAEGVAESDILAKYDLEEDASMSRCLVFCEIYKKDGEWRFNAVNESKGSYNDTTYHQVLTSYGIQSEPYDL
jgi:tellurium resistance protein TerD